MLLPGGHAWTGNGTYRRAIESRLDWGSDQLHTYRGDGYTGSDDANRRRPSQTIAAYDITTVRCSQL